MGPSLVWAPLLAYALLRKSTRVRGVLVLWSAVAWLGLSMPLRFTTLVVGWDPSGHVLVVGLQLVPLWLLLQAGAAAEGTSGGSGNRDNGSAGGGSALAPVALAVAEVLAAVLALITLSTAAFFHSASEVLSAWAVTSAVLAAMATRLSPAWLRALDGARRAEARATLDKALVGSGAVCAVAGALAVLLLRAMPVPTFVGYALHDLATFAVARYVVLPACLGGDNYERRRALKAAP